MHDETAGEGAEFGPAKDVDDDVVDGVGVRVEGRVVAIQDGLERGLEL